MNQAHGFVKAWRFRIVVLIHRMYDSDKQQLDGLCEVKFRARENER